jgi:hypothetical protein
MREPCPSQAIPLSGLRSTARFARLQNERWALVHEMEKGLRNVPDPMAEIFKRLVQGLAIEISFSIHSLEPIPRD